MPVGILMNEADGRHTASQHKRSFGWRQVITVTSQMFVKVRTSTVISQEYTGSSPLQMCFAIVSITECQFISFISTFSVSLCSDCNSPLECESL